MRDKYLFLVLYLENSNAFGIAITYKKPKKRGSGRVKRICVCGARRPPVNAPSHQQRTMNCANWHTNHHILSIVTHTAYMRRAGSQPTSRAASSLTIQHLRWRRHSSCFVQSCGSNTLPAANTRACSRSNGSLPLRASGMPASSCSRMPSRTSRPKSAGHSSWFSMTVA
jgi:hypothetical protein